MSQKKNSQDWDHLNKKNAAYNGSYHRIEHLHAAVFILVVPVLRVLLLCQTVLVKKLQSPYTHNDIFEDKKKKFIRGDSN